MKLSEKGIGLAFLTVTICLFSTFEVTSKFLSPYMLPTQITFTRFFIGGMILLPFAVHRMVRKRGYPSPRDYAKFALLGIVNIVISMGLIQLGLVYTNASVCAVLFSINPLFVSLFARAILHERITARKLAGLVLGIVGMVMLFIDGVASKTSTIFGMSLILASSVFFAFYTVLGKRIITKDVDSVIVTAFSFVFGSACMIPVQIALNIAIVPNVSAVIPELLYMSLFVTGMAYVTYFAGLSRQEAGAGSMLYFAKPALASLLAGALLHDRIGARMISGMAVIAVGIFVAQTNGRKRTAPNGSANPADGGAEGKRDPREP